MIIKTKLTSWSILILVISGSLIPIPARAGKYAAEFLHIGIGARALGMGGAFITLANDATASYWNAAGLGNLARSQLHFSHVQLFDNIAHHNFASISLKLNNHLGIAMSWLRLSVDDIPRYPQLQGTRYDRFANPELRSTGRSEGFFGDIEDAILLSFGKAFDFDLVIGGGFMPLLLPTQFNVGVSYKYISQKLDAAEGQGQGLDLGIKVSFYKILTHNNFPQRNLSLGVNCQDVAGTTIIWNTTNKTKERRPTNLLLGVSYSEWLHWLKSQITLSLARDHRYRSTNQWGSELNFNNIFSLRMGMCDKHFTTGIGLKLLRFHIDYAFVSYDLGNSHRISGAAEF